MLAEDKFTELRAGMDEIYSSMVILQQAVKNEYEEANTDDINNHLELVVNRLKELRSDAFKLQDELFTTK